MYSPTNPEGFDDSPDKLNPLIRLFIVVFLTWLISFFIFIKIYNNPSTISEFGDAFGAINALFSGFAFAGIIYTILLQRKELVLQRKELVETRKELRRSAIAQEKSEEALRMQIESMKLTSKLNALNSIVEALSQEYSSLMSYDIPSALKVLKEREVYMNQIKKALKSIEVDIDLDDSKEH
ncbi:MAG: hypothetical protein FD166_2988 [Bacteroidetes bacterium]|nr:MAG: hypothetical protein FD166_2988 [Bacteroidota bacterium]